MPDTAVLIYSSEAPYDWPLVWERAGVYKRIERLGLPVILIGGTSPRSLSGAIVVRPSIADLIASEEYKGVERFAILETSQVFFDIDVAVRALSAAMESAVDLYTQWEHVRLPVGIGLRIVSRRLLSEGAWKSIDELINVVNGPSSAATIKYDPSIYCSHDDSLLDFRWSEELNSFLHEDHDDWSLRGALRIAQTTDAKKRLRYNNVKDKGNLDHRGLPARYGFEAASASRFPGYIMYDLTNRCNAACKMCPQSVGFSGQSEIKMLAPRTFFKVIDECVGKDIRLIRITADGEPTIHPKFWTLLEYARNRKVGPIGLTTNGSTLTDKNIRRLISSKVAFVDVSLDAFSKDVFEKVRVGLGYERVVGNVHRLIELNLQSGRPMRIMVSFVVQEDNKHEKDDFIQYWEDRVDQVLIREMTSNVGLTSRSNRSSDLPQRWPCPHFWRRVVVNYNNELKACPIDWNNQLSNKSLDEEAISQQWHGPFYHQYRLQHLNNDHDDESLCRDCRDWATTPWEFGYEKVVKKLL